MTGEHWDAIEQVIDKLYCYDPTIDAEEKKDLFRTEMKNFQDQTGVFDKPSRWSTAEAGRKVIKTICCQESILGHLASQSRH